MSSEIVTIIFMLIGSTFVFGLFLGVRSFFRNRLPAEKPQLSPKKQAPIQAEMVRERPLHEIRPADQGAIHAPSVATDASIVAPMPKEEPQIAPKEANSSVKPIDPTKVVMAKIDSTLVIPAQNDVVYEAIFQLPNTNGKSKDKPSFYLYCTKGEYAGNRIELTNEGIMIGRNPALVHLVVPNDEISGKHVKVSPSLVSALGMVIEDFGSTNGTEYQLSHVPLWVRLNGRRLFPPNEVQGLRLRLAEGIIEFEIKSI
jgi:hypothetical protein